MVFFGKKSVLLWCFIALFSCNYSVEKKTKEKKTISPHPTSVTAAPHISYQQLQEIVLLPHCLECHNESKKRGGLDLSSHTKIIASNALQCGDSGRSLIYQRVHAGEMPPPPRRPVPTEEQKVLQRWINEGCAP